MKRSLGRYELRETIRPGAIGTVWEAWDEALARQVAVEIVPLGQGGADRGADRGTVMARFRQEAQVAGQLTRAGLVQVYDLGETAGEAYIVREFVGGESLRQGIDRVGTVSVARAVVIMRGVLDTLEACHRLGIVHREIRPDNILLPGGDRVKLTGFGVPPMASAEATLSGSAWDIAPYKSPEQITEQSPTDARSDLWSCGVVLYEMLTGQQPFRSASAATTGQAIVHDDPAPPSSLRPDLPHALGDLILRALRKAPAERFASAAAFADALQMAAADAPAPPMPAAARAFPLRAALLGAGAVAVLVGGWVFWSRDAPASLSQRVRAIPCSTVSVADDAGGATSFRGIIGSGAPRAALDAITGASTVAVQEFPSSPVSCRMAEIVRAHAGGQLLLQGGGAPLQPGNDIRLKLRAPAFDGQVRLEDLDAAGMVQHVMEANLGAPPRFAAGATIGLGRNGDDLIGRATDSPGSEMLVAIMTASPLFAEARPVTESGAAYLDAFERALDVLQRQGGAVSMDAAVLTIVRPAH